MAIRKLRKKMKPLIWVFTIAFLISLLAVVVANVRMVGKNKTDVLAVNGMKVGIRDVERAYNSRLELYSGYYSKSMPQETVKTIAVNDVVEQKILLSLAKKLKVKVSKKELDETYTRSISGIKDKEELKRRLLTMGFTTKTFKKYIENAMIAEKVKEKIQEDYKPEDGLALEEYNRNKYGAYLNKEFDDVKDEIEENLVSLGKIKYFKGFIEKQKKQAEIDLIDENYSTYLEKTDFEEAGFEVSSVDIANRVLIQKLYGQEDDEKARQTAIDGLKKEIALAKTAMDKGIEKDTSLGTMDQIEDLISKLRWHFVENAELSETQLKKYFAESKSAYDTQEEAEIKLVSFKLEPRERDEKAAQEKAAEILKKVTVENFPEMAKEYSVGPTAVKGGDLGWFSKNIMVKEFSDAVFAGNVGEVYPEVVKSPFGYHIIYIADKNEEKQEAKASHILIRAETGEDSKNETYTEAQKELVKLENGEIDFASLAKEKSRINGNYQITGIKRGTYVAEVGYDSELNDAIFSSEIGKNEILKTKEGVYIFEKTLYTPFKKAEYESAKARVKYDLSVKTANEKIKEMLK